MPYAESKYGLVRRMFSIPQTKDDVATAGTLTEAFFVVPRRSNLVAFGIMSAASDVVLATSDGFELRTGKGTYVATFVAHADYTLGSGRASKAAPDTATALKANKPYVACVGTNVGVSGSVYYFIDYKERFLESQARD